MTAENAEFDKFAGEYRDLHQSNIRISGEEPEFFADYKVRDLREYFSSTNKVIRDVLDFGCGVGTSIPFFRKYFPGANLSGIDVSPESIKVADSRFGSLGSFQTFDGARLPFEDERFDLVFAACVFHHIPHDEHVALLTEWRRVLRPGGFAAIFEHNPYNPLTRHAVNTCPFDENAVLITSSKMRRTFRMAGFPTSLRRFRIFIPGPLSFLRPLEHLLYWCPAGAQYSVVARRL